MKKTIILMLMALLMLSCTQSVEKATEELKQETGNIIEQLEQCNDETEAEKLFEEYISLITDYLHKYGDTEQGIDILRENYYLLTLEELEDVFDALKQETLENEKIASIYSNFLIQKATSEGNQFIDFSALTPEGEELSLSSIIGKTDYVLVDFWASWCGPCRQSMPQMKNLYKEANGRLQILGVSLDNDKEKWLNAIATLDLPWLHISDLKGWKSIPAGLYGINAIPATILIDKNGLIVGRNLDTKDIMILLSE